MTKTRKNERQRFDSKVVRSDSGCWSWVGAKTKLGYGKFARAGGVGRWEFAHRAAWRLQNGPPPDAAKVLHSCDNRSCVRPEHLSLGTQVDNIRDMISKGRHAHGESHFSAKFTEAEVLEMRRRHAAGETYAGIARSVGRPFGMVNLAIKGVTWSHLTTSQHEGQG